MNKFSLLSLLLVTGCTWGSPPCPELSNDDKDGIYLRNLGSVVIDNESCSIIETIKKTDCIIQ
jgi:hypothetical protein